MPELGLRVPEAVPSSWLPCDLNMMGKIPGEAFVARKDGAVTQTYVMVSRKCIVLGGVAIDVRIDTVLQAGTRDCPLIRARHGSRG